MTEYKCPCQVMGILVYPHRVVVKNVVHWLNLVFEYNIYILCMFMHNSVMCGLIGKILFLLEKLLVVLSFYWDLMDIRTVCACLNENMYFVFMHKCVSCIHIMYVHQSGSCTSWWIMYTNEEDSFYFVWKVVFLLVVQFHQNHMMDSKIG